MQLEVVGLRFKPAGKILQYVANRLALHRGEKCVAESENGLEIATVVLAPHTVDLQEGSMTSRQSCVKQLSRTSSRRRRSVSVPRKHSPCAAAVFGKLTCR